MKKILLLTLALSVCVSAQIDTNSQHFYMYSYFYNKQQEAGARLAFSSDGVHWVLYNNETPVIVPVIAKGETPLMRDPNILFDPNTGVFHLTWTTAWNQDNIGYATSKDLKTWSEQIMIPVGQRIRGASCCWAPEFFYDDLKDSVMVFWSTERGTVGKEAFCSMTKDFKHYTAPRVYFSPKNANGEAYSVIDETILKVADNKYYMFYKDERTNNVAGKWSKNIHFVFGPTPQGPWWVGPWDDGSNPISGVGTEGPSAIIIGDEVRVFFDPYNTPENTNRSVKSMKTNFLGTEPAAISSFTPGEAMVTETGNFLPGHGSISEIPRAKVMQILYGIPDPTVYPQSWTHPAQSEMFVEEMPVEVRNYPMGKQNHGCGTGFGLAFLPPLIFKSMKLHRRKKQKAGAK